MTARPPDVRLAVRNLDVCHDRDDPDAFRLRVEAFTAEGGEMIGLAGRNGSGKSTLLEVAGLLRLPQSGLGGAPFELCLEYAEGGGVRRCTFTAPALRRGIGELNGDERLRAHVRNELYGYMFQSHYLLPSLTARDNLTLPLLLRPDADPRRFREQAEAFLRDFELRPSDWDNYPAELSVGQKQRLAIGRALAHRPRIYLADEPSAALDGKTKRKTLDLLRALADAGNIVILVTHELPDLAEYVDRLALIRDGRLTHPFADRDDPAPASSPPLSPLPASPGAPRRRTEEEVRRITQVLTDALRLDAPAGPAPVRATAPAAGAPAPESNPGCPTARRLGLRGRVWRYAWAELAARQQFPVRLIFALLLLSGVTAFAFPTDLGRGTVRYLREHTLGPDEMINRLIVNAPVGRTMGQEDLTEFSGSPGLKAPPTGIFQDSLLAVLDVHGEYDTVTGISLPSDDPLLRLVPDRELGTARVGLRYLHGGPCDPARPDEAWVIVTPTFLREKYWRLQDGDPTPPYPEFLELRLAAHPGGRKDLPGLNGRVRVPVVGVAELPPLAAADPSARLADLIVSEAFLRRSQDWQPGWALVYPGANGRPLAPELSLVETIRVTVAGAKNRAWADDKAVRDCAGARFGPVTLQGGGDELLLTLHLHGEPGHRLTAEQYRRELWPGLCGVVREVSGGEPELGLSEVPARRLAPSLPALDELPPRYTRVILRFERLEDVLPAKERIQAAFPHLECHNLKEAAIRQMLSARTLVSQGTGLMRAVFLLGLVFLLGIAAHAHIASRSADVGTLLAHGMSWAGVAWLYFIELVLLMVPACLLGLALAWVAAALSNDALAPLILGDASGAQPAAPRIFLSLQQGPSALLGEALLLIGWVLGVLAACSFGRLWLMRRKPIIDLLRAGPG